MIGLCSRFRNVQTIARSRHFHVDKNGSERWQAFGYHEGMIRAINAITIAGGIVLLVMSLWPGYAGGCLLLLALPLIAMLGLAWLIVVALAASHAKGTKPLRVRQVLVAPLVVCLTYGMLTFYIPRRIAFRVVQSRFDSLVPSATVSEDGGTKLDRWLGIYHVDEYAADPRGGVYFRTGSAPDGISPDTMSYGFAFQPNGKGTPFGEARYVVRSLGRGWYWFEVSDD